jgi:hypothetical protein
MIAFTEAADNWGGMRHERLTTDQAWDDPLTLHSAELFPKYASDDGPDLLRHWI